MTSAISFVLIALALSCAWLSAAPSEYGNEADVDGALLIAAIILALCGWWLA